MPRKVLLASIVGVISLIFLAPPAGSAPVTSRFDVTLSGIILPQMVWRDGIMFPDDTGSGWAEPGRVLVAGVPVSTREGQWFFYAGRTQINLRIKGPDVNFLGKATTSALFSMDFNASGSRFLDNPIPRFRFGVIDVDWARKAFTTKLRIGNFVGIANGITVMSTSSPPFFSGSLVYPYEPQISLHHTFTLDKTTKLIVQYGAFWITGPGQTRTNQRGLISEAEEPAFQFAATLSGVLWGKKPASIKTDFVWARLKIPAIADPIPATPLPKEAVGDSYVWTNAFVLPLFGGLTLNGEVAWGQATSFYSMDRLGMFVPPPFAIDSQSGLPVNVDRARVRRAASWFTWLNWEATKKLTFNAAYGQILVSPGDVLRPTAASTIVTPAGLWFERQWEYLFNVFYKFSPNWTLAAEYHKFHTKYVNARFYPVATNRIPAGTLGLDVKDAGRSEIEVLFRYDF